MATVSQVGSNSATQSNNQIQSGSTLNRDDFLRLLVTQLQHQDPIEPIKDQEFAAQMAQFSSLEAVQSLAGQFDRFINLQQWTSQIGQATGLIGKTIDLNVDGQTVTGQVSAVRMVEGVVKVVLDGQEYDFTQLAEVRA